MSYPVECLKRGGRFYLCRVADISFAAVTHRQLWSQDVRKICDDLMEVIKNELGRPANRFSLQLSSQLMRGLVRIYQKQVNVYLNNLCMMIANVDKHTNKRYIIHEDGEGHRASRLWVHVVKEQPPQITLPQEPENKQPIEEIRQDGFGEENPLQALQLLAVDRSVELMLAAGELPDQNSGLEPALNVTDLFASRNTRVLPRTRLMERLSEHDATIFRRSNGEEIIPYGDFEKDIQMSEIPDIVIPEIPIPPQEQLPSEPEITETREKPARFFKKTATADIKEIELEDSTADIIDLRPPCEVYMRRPSHAGAALRSNLSPEIKRLFMRNLGLVHRSPTAEREFQEDIMYPQRAPTKSMLERIKEVEEPPVAEIPQPQIDNGTHPENVTYPEISLVQDVRDILPQMEKEVDISDMLTQKLQSISLTARKRKSTQDNIPTQKRQRSMAYVSFRESQKSQQMDIELAPLFETTSELTVQHAEKEIVPENMQTLR